MVCLYFYHPGGAPWFSCFFVFLFGGISGAFLGVPACFFWCGFPVFFFVLFLVSFGDFAGGIFCAFSGGFSTVFWCFFPCIFSCLSLFFSISVSPWWWSCFLPCFFWWFLGAFSVLFSVLFFVFFFCVFFCAFYRAFFRAFFRSFSCFFSCFFFRALGGTQDKQPQYFAFWPVLFLVLFLVVTTSEDRKYTKYTIYLYYPDLSCIPWPLCDNATDVACDWLNHSVKVRQLHATAASRCSTTLCMTFLHLQRALFEAMSLIEKNWLVQWFHAL